MARALAQTCGPLVELNPLKERFGKTKTVLYQTLARHKYRRELDLSLHRYLSEQVDKLLTAYPSVDVVVSPGCLPYPNLFLQSRKPVVYWSDATFANLVDVHPNFTSLTAREVRSGHEIQRLMLSGCAAAVFASRWAADAARQYYGIDERKIVVAPFGANIDEALAPAEVPAVVAARGEDVCRLLFVCRDWWTAKGGPQALRIASLLNRSGLRAELTIIGNRPPVADLPANVKYAGLLRKGIPAERELLEQLYRQSHFLLAPTTIECFGIALCEAGNFAVPVVASDVGGIPEVISIGVSGKIFPFQASDESYCAYIADLFSRPDEYRQLALSAFNYSSKTFNWNRSATIVQGVLSRVCGLA